jgi:hypothetical protein
MYLPTRVGVSKNNKFETLLYVYGLASRVVELSLRNTNGPISLNIPSMEEHPKK